MEGNKIFDEWAEDLPLERKVRIAEYKSQYQNYQKRENKIYQFR